MGSEEWRIGSVLCSVHVVWRVSESFVESGLRVVWRVGEGCAESGLRVVWRVG